MAVTPDSNRRIFPEVSRYVDMKSSIMAFFWSVPRLAGASRTMALFTPCASCFTLNSWMLSEYFRVLKSTETGEMPEIPFVEMKGTCTM